MSVTGSISNTDKVNYLNIGLMLVSLVMAFYVPFELFLFSYAVLGPAHYLTEISWLHERKYFTKGKYDFVFLGLAGVMLFLVIYMKQMIPSFDYFEKHSEFKGHLTTGLVFVSFVAAFAMVLLKDSFHRFIAFVVICFSAVISKYAVIFFSVFLPTLIHVYLFTLLFMLYGALKGRSKSGYLASIILVLCPVVIVLFTPNLNYVSAYALETYPQFHAVNFYALNLFDSDLYTMPPGSQEGYNSLIHSTYYSTLGLMIMRFIAFAYTYHYLNWFSKTTVIKWHAVPKKRLAVIAVLWIASVGFYAYNYRLGFNILFLLSFLHVFLEFPLNHITFIGIFEETKSIITGKTASPASMKKK
jgi:hypothetical protein